MVDFERNAMPFCHSQELGNVNFAVLDANSVKELPHGVRDLRGNQPHQHVPLATSLQFILVARAMVLLASLT